MAAPRLQPSSARVVSDFPTLQRVVAAYRSRKSRVYLDTETTGLNPRRDALVAVQLYQEGAPSAVIVDFRKAWVEWAEELQLLFEEVVIVGHNLNFDVQFLMRHGMHPKRVFDTMIAEQVIHGVGVESAETALNLRAVVYKYAGFDMSKEERNWFIDLDKREEMTGTGGPPDYLEEFSRPWDEPFPTEQIEYMANDVLYLPQVFKAQVAELESRKLTRTMQLEMRALVPIASMEMNGIRVDAEQWREVIRDKEEEAKRLHEELLVSDLAQAILKARQQRFDEAQQKLEEWKLEQEAVIYSARETYDRWNAEKDDPPYERSFLAYAEMTPEGNEKWGEYKKRVLAEWKERHPRPDTPDKKLRDVNLGSSQQLKEGLGILGIDIPNTEAETLEKASARFPILKPFVAWRQASKFVSTYGENLLARIEEDGRLHPRFKQIGAETGRMSSAEPNFQNIPARTVDGKRLRMCVKAEPGHSLLVADYDIVELRILADMSGDEEMLRLFESGVDLHTYTARRMFNLPDTMTDDEVKTYRLPSGLKARDVAKTINYASVYGQSIYGFARKFNVSVDEAQGFLDKQHALFPGATKWLEERGQFAIDNLHSKTVLGRKRFYELPQRPQGWQAVREYERLVASVRRAGMNHPIQGTSADITKLAIALFYENTDERLGKLVAVVHDEIVVESPDEHAGVIKLHLEECMLKAARTFLKTVYIPRPKAHIGEAWEH
jgi:DNA polymerase I-like protein with 3'-5' exonuclease and polymerase domains